MRNFLNFALLVLPILPFSFWKMEGPYSIRTYLKGSNSNSSQEVIDDVILINKYGSNRSIFESVPNQTFATNYLLNYNHNLGYSIVYGYVPHILDSGTKDLARQALSTLRGYADFTNFSISFYAVRENFGKNIRNIKLGDFHSFKKALADNNTPRIKIQQTFTSSSGVLINNLEDNVEIKKGNTTYNFEEKLLQYFSPSKKNLKSMKSTISPISKTFNIQDQPVASFKMGAQELQRLQNSTILAVYGVLKGNTNKDSVIWGLAKDKRTEKLFHWITDIQNDISDLL